MVKSDREIVKQFSSHRKMSERGLSLQKTEDVINLGYWSGDEQFYNTNITDETKEMVVLNRVKPFVDAVTGFMIQNRLKPKYMSLDENIEVQEAQSNFLNGVSEYARENSNADQMESLQDLYMVITGVGAIDTNLTYDNYDSTDNPNGQIIMEAINPLQVFWDPEASKPNLIDSRWVYRVQRMRIDEAEDLFDAEEEDFEPSSQSTGSSNVFFDPSTATNVTFDFDRVEKDIVNVFYYQWFEIEKYFRVDNPLIQLQQFDPALTEQLFRAYQIIQVDNDDKDERNKLIDDPFKFDPEADVLVMNAAIKRLVDQVTEQLTGVKLEFLEDKRKVYFTAILSGNKVFTKYKNIDQQSFNIKFKTASYDLNQRIWFGLVTQLRVPALFSNKITTELLRVIASNSKGGVLVEESAVEDHQQFEQEYAKTGSSVVVNDGALKNGRIQPKQTPISMSGYGDMLPMFNAALNDVSGFDKGFLGSSENRAESATLQRQRIKQSVTMLAQYFDSISLYQKMQARTMISLMRVIAEESNGRIFRTLDQDGNPVNRPLMRDEFALEYDVTTREVPQTAQAEKENFELLMNYATQIAATTGQNIYPALVDTLPVDSEQKRKIKEALNPQPTPEQQQAQQQQQQQIQQQQQQQAEIQQVVLESQKAQIGETIATARDKQASADQRQADTLKKIQDAERTELENDLLAEQIAAPILRQPDVNINI